MLASLYRLVSERKGSEGVHVKVTEEPTSTVLEAGVSSTFGIKLLETVCMCVCREYHKNNSATNHLNIVTRF